MNDFKIPFIVVSVFLCILAVALICTHHTPKHHKHVLLEKPDVVRTYKSHNPQSTSDANFWIYWYIINSSNGSTYYASSPSPSSSYSSLSFSKTAPPAAQIEKAEQVGATKEITPEQEPQEVQQAEHAAEAIAEESMDETGIGADASDQASESAPASESSASESSSSSDSSASSGDSSSSSGSGD